ncbi:MAG: alpha-amylase family glycosyl hydrolase [Eubacteriales bacterium]|nr:alpha-amylase family glycosyl hydrolase [Eubacteriales bacterium]
MNGQQDRWYEKSVFYQIYPLGFCGAPQENDGNVTPRIRKVLDWIPHLKRLHMDAVYFCPVFESDRHGYDTRDYRRIDARLGSNADFADVCRALHENGMHVVLDGVFNHVGRGFFAFQDVLKNREHSPYKDWFFLNFGGNSCFNDGFWYEGWEGHYELVKLNLRNPEVTAYLFESIRGWVEAFQIDGLRLDVAYCLDTEFLRKLRSFCEGLKPDFFLVGEILSGDYRRIIGPGLLQSCTNYECRKGLYSSFNDLNLFEIGHSLDRMFGQNNQYALYKGEHLLSFVDNHDVTRAATILKEKRHLPLLYGLLFGMPGIPCIYYGSEWGAEGDRTRESDAALRPSFDAPEWNRLSDLIAALSYGRENCPALSEGSYRHILLQNRQLVIERALSGTDQEERIWIALNIDSMPYRFSPPAGERAGRAEVLLSWTGAAENQDPPCSDENKEELSKGVILPPYSLSYWRLRTGQDRP